MALKPAKLNKGDTIGVLTPASPPKKSSLNLGLQYLQTQGYQYRLSPHALVKGDYLAGSDEDRANDLHIMFSDPEIHAVFCSRGGYGSIRLLSRIDFDLIKRYPKIFVGYSDLTAFQLAAYKYSGLVSFAGPMVAADMHKPLSKYVEDSFWNLLTDSKSPGKRVNPDGNEPVVINPGKATGVLLGGCLSVLCSLLGTDFLPDFAGSILFLEDIGEETYRIDKYFAQLKLAGILDSAAGIAFGKFADCPPRKRKKNEKNLHELFSEYTAELKIPVMADISFGHIPEKMTIPIGVRGTLDSAKRILSIDEGAVV